MSSIILWLKISWKWVKQSKYHYLFSVFTFSVGWVLGMLTTPLVGAIFITFSIYLALVIYIPWDYIKFIKKFRKFAGFILSAIIVISIVIPLWSHIIYVFPSNSPYRELIRNATATVEVTISSSEKVNTHFLDQGGGLAFMINDYQSILLVSAMECSGKQTGGDRVQYRGVFNLDTTSNYTKNCVYALKNTEYILVIFVPIPENSYVLEGKAIVTINNTVRIEFNIPAQQMVGNLIVIEDIEDSFKEFWLY